MYRNMIWWQVVNVLIGCENPEAQSTKGEFTFFLELGFKVLAFYFRYIGLTIDVPALSTPLQPPTKTFKMTSLSFVEITACGIRC